MKLLLMADQHVGMEITSWLIDSYREDIAFLVCTSENDIFRYAQKAGIKCGLYQSGEEIVQDFQRQRTTFDLGILAWWPYIVKPPLLDFPRLGFINTHPSLLPFNRGKHYNFWALVEQAPFGVTLHFVDKGVDTGDIVAQRVIPYGWEDTGASLYSKASEEIIALFKERYSDFRQLDIQRRPQEIDKGSFHLANEIDSISYIDLDKQYKARDILNLLRARTFPGYPACWFKDDDQEFEVSITINRKTK